METKILKYLLEKDIASDIKISEELNLELLEVRRTLNQLRNHKFIKATDGWDQTGRNSYTNIKITPQGLKSLKNKKAQPKQATHIKIGINNGIVSTGSKSKNTQKSKINTNKEETPLSKGCSLIMGIIATVISGAILYYLKLT